jgi:hypothetical protein
MMRWLAFCFGIQLALAANLVAQSYTNETFPVVHNEPIFVRVVNGQDGAPLVHVHLNLYAGYDEADIRRQVWHEETLTDEHGQARLSSQLANLPFLQVWPAKMQGCQANPRASRFSVERIRRDGLSTPNRCGVAMVKDAPGVFTVYVRAKKSTTQPATLPDNAVKSIPSGNEHAQPASTKDELPATGLGKNVLRAVFVLKCFLAETCRRSC